MGPNGSAEPIELFLERLDLAHLQWEPLGQATEEAATLRIAATALFLILGGATLAFASAQPGNSRHSRFRSTQIPCGTERRDVKQLRDGDAKNVAFGQAIESTVKRAGMLTRPAHTGITREPKERCVYRIKAIFDSTSERKLGYQIEKNDNDIHLAVRDNAGNTLIVEFPMSAAPRERSTATR